MQPQHACCFPGMNSCFCLLLQGKLGVDVLNYLDFSTPETLAQTSAARSNLQSSAASATNNSQTMTRQQGRTTDDTVQALDTSPDIHMSTAPVVAPCPTLSAAEMPASTVTAVSQQLDQQPPLSTSKSISRSGLNHSRRCSDAAVSNQAGTIERQTSKPLQQRHFGKSSSKSSSFKARHGPQKGASRSQLSETGRSCTSSSINQLHSTANSAEATGSSSSGGSMVLNMYQEAMAASMGRERQQPVQVDKEEEQPAVLSAALQPELPVAAESSSQQQSAQPLEDMVDQNMPPEQIDNVSIEPDDCTDTMLMSFVNSNQTDMSNASDSPATESATELLCNETPDITSTPTQSSMDACTADLMNNACLTNARPHGNVISFDPDGINQPAVADRTAGASHMNPDAASSGTAKCAGQDSQVQGTLASEATLLTSEAAVSSNGSNEAGIEPGTVADLDSSRRSTMEDEQDADEVDRVTWLRSLTARPSIPHPKAVPMLDLTEVGPKRY